MIEILRQINAQDFLWYYAFYSIIIFISLWIIKNKKISNVDDNLYYRVSPYMAALMKNPRSIINFIFTIITVLYAKKIIDISDNNGSLQISINQSSSFTQLDKSEKIFIDHILQPKTVSELIQDRTLLSSLSNARVDIIERLKEGYYVVSDKLIFKLDIIKFCFMVLLFAPYFMKFYVGINNPKHSLLFYFMIMVINFIIIHLVGETGYLTSKGNKYLKDMKLQLESSQIRKNSSLVLENAGYFVAILGIGGILSLPELGIIYLALKPYNFLTYFDGRGDSSD